MVSNDLAMNIGDYIHDLVTNDPSLVERIADSCLAILQEISMSSQVSNEI